VFDHISKHLEIPQKYSATRRIFNSLLGVWKCGQTRSLVFDILHKTMPTVFVLWVQKLALLFAKLFLFYKNMLYKKIEFEICEIGRFLKRI